MKPNRRAFVGALFGGALAPRYLPAGTVVCDSNQYQYPAGLDPPRSSHKHYKFHSRQQSRRPLWSELSAPDRADLATKMQRAYEHLIHLSLRHPDHPGGLLGQAWMHNAACADPFSNIHASSSFLPWHRAFLYFHERLLQKALRDPLFRLPVWDWDADKNVPAIFDQWLNIPGANDCAYLQASTVDAPLDPPTLQAWLLSHCFIDFAGGKNAAGSAPYGPHSNVHASLGGLMRRPKTSALHPVFYLHHANVDRYWCAWWESYKDFDGFKPEWPEAPWTFYDHEHGFVRVCPEQLMNTPELGYDYKLPADSFYHFTMICGTVQNNRVGIDARSLFGLLNRLLDEQSSAAPAFPLDPVETVTRLVLQAGTRFPKLSLPVRIELTSPDAEPGTSYPLRLSGTDASEIVGNVSIFGGEHHHTASVIVPASLSLTNAGLWRDLFTTGAQLSLDASGETSSPQRLDVASFKILYPMLDKYPDVELKAFLGVS